MEPPSIYSTPLKCKRDKIRVSQRSYCNDPKFLDAYPGQTTHGSRSSLIRVFAVCNAPCIFMKHFSVVFKFLFKFCSDDTNFLKISYCKFWSRQVSQPVLLSLHCLLFHLMAILKGRTSLFNFQSVCNKYELRHEKTCFFAYAKTKSQISCAVAAQMISNSIFATYM